MPRRFQKTLVDYLVVAISPALIMTLVGSLVLFLLEVFYQGNFHGRLQWIFALFIVGAVSVGRISVEQGRERASLFALPLGIVTLLAINRFVEFQGEWLSQLSFLVNLGLIALIWWSADKLTWDCTLIDESQEDSGEGLLEVVGLDRPDRTSLQRELTPMPPESEPNASSAQRSWGWWERFVERRRRPHAPGVWIVYYSLAALPLFGIGQLFIPADDLAARQYAFQLLLVYTASGLGLLLATSFLGLRRYLRQRRQPMPLRMVNLWLGIGVALIVGVMSAAMFLPRPNAEYAVSELPFRVSSPDQKSSPYATGRDEIEQRRPWSRGRPSKAEPSDSTLQNQSGKTQSKDQKNRPSSGESSSSANKPPTNSQTTAQTDQRSETGQKTVDSSQTKADSGKKAIVGRSAAERKSSQDRQDQPSNNDKQTAKTPHILPMPHVPLPNRVPLSLTWVKWLLYGALALAAIYWIWRSRHQIWAAIQDLRQWLSGLWHGVFGHRIGRTDGSADEPDSRKPLRRFADFTDPFASGLAASQPPEELVRYTFEAFEAWARDHGYARHPEQTPHEFVRSVVSHVSSLSDSAKALADLYCQAAYASATLSAASVNRLSQLWQRLRAPPVAGG